MSCVQLVVLPLENEQAEPAVKNPDDSGFSRSTRSSANALQILQRATHEALLLAKSGTVTNASTFQAEARSIAIVAHPQEHF